MSLPANWKDFINLRDNKTNLIQFLCQQLFIKAEDLDDKQIVVAGGLDEPIKTVSSTGRNVDHLYSSHEEANQRMVLHAVDTKEMGFIRTVISSRDTDVLVLFIHHYAKLSQETWLKAGTSNDPKYIPVHNVAQSLPDHFKTGFHRLAGSDTTSQFREYAKLSAWKIFTKHAKLFDSFGNNMTNEFEGAERFTMKMYCGPCNVATTDELREDMFHNTKPENIPPTSDALHQHLLRCARDTVRYTRDTQAHLNLPQLEQCG